MSRVFFGLSFSDKFSSIIQKSLVKIQKDIKKKQMEFQWVKPENYHLTTNFIGEVSQSQLIRLKELGSEVSKTLSSFKLEPKELSCFPDEMAARVLYLKFRSNKGLIQLRNSLEESLLDANIYCDQKEFIPHLTIARTRKQRNMKDSLSLVPKFKYPLLIDNFLLLKNPESGDTPNYQVIQKYELAKEESNLDT